MSERKNDRWLDEGRLTVLDMAVLLQSVSFPQSCPLGLCLNEPVIDIL